MTTEAAFLWEDFLLPEASVPMEMTRKALVPAGK